MPWDQTTVVGYLCKLIFSISVAEVFFLFRGSLVLLYISMCLQHQAFYKRFRYSLQNLANENRNDQEFLSDLIQFLNATRTWFSNSADVFSLFMLMELIYNVVVLACGIFLLDLVRKTCLKLSICSLSQFFHGNRY